MERISVSSMMYYFDTHNKLFPQQHECGPPKYSCATQLIGFTQEIADTLNQGQQTDGIVIDLSKASDQVDHHKLVHKLKYMGVNPYITIWIKDFVHNSSQQGLGEKGLSQAPCALLVSHRAWS